MPDDLALVDDPFAPLVLEVERPLTDDDLPALRTSVRAPSTSSPLSIRASHHALARLLAGGASREEASLVTGYTPQRITDLQRDDTFQALVEHYQGGEALATSDLISKIRLISSSALDELLKRLEESAGEIPRRELLDIALAGVKTMPEGQPGAGGPRSGVAPPLNVNISFVKAPARELPGEVIEGEVK